MNLLTRIRTSLQGPLLMSRNRRYAKFHVGRWSYGRPAIYQWDVRQKLTIGAFCSIAADVVILLGGEHRTDFVSTYPFGNFLNDAYHNAHEWSRGGVVIGNDVWIGHGALILSGAEIGDGAVVGARAVVSGKVPPYAIVAGQPAKVVRYRFEPEIIDGLLKSRWWTWSDEKIRENIPLLMSNDVDEFLKTRREETRKATP